MIHYYKSKDNLSTFSFDDNEYISSGYPQDIQNLINEYIEIEENEFNTIQQHIFESLDNYDTNKQDILQQINALKQQLTDTDYVIIKINEALILNNMTLVEELKSTYADIISQRQVWRNEISRLEKTL